MLALALAVIAAADPAIAAIDADAKAVDAQLKKLATYQVSAGQEYSLEGSSGDAWATRDGKVRKIVMSFLGETYRSRVTVYVNAGAAVRAEMKLGRYRGGMQDPVIVGTTVVRVYLDGEKVLASWDAKKKPADAESASELVKMVRGFVPAIVDCVAKAQAGTNDPACDEVVVVTR